MTRKEIANMWTG